MRHLLACLFLCVISGFATGATAAGISPSGHVLRLDYHLSADRLTFDWFHSVRGSRGSGGAGAEPDMTLTDIDGWMDLAGGEGAVTFSVQPTRAAAAPGIAPQTSHAFKLVRARFDGHHRPGMVYRDMVLKPGDTTPVQDVRRIPAKIDLHIAAAPALTPLTPFQTVAQTPPPALTLAPRYVMRLQVQDWQVVSGSPAVPGPYCDPAQFSNCHLYASYDVTILPAPLPAGLVSALTGLAALLALPVARRWMGSDA